MATHSGSNTWRTEEDSDSLFIKHSIAEIRLLSENTRKDISEKREELRQMVGERYRDLISAADTIVEIRNAASKVSSLLGNLKDDLLQVQQVHQLKGFAGGAKSLEGPSSQSFMLMAQLKLFVDLPTKLWSCLETKSCLKAAQYHLLAQYIAHKLNLEEGRGEGVRLLRTFPVFSNHWSSLSNIQSSILSTCRESLRNASLSEQSIAECLCAILLLDGSSLRQVFNEFLLARKMAIQSILHSQEHSISIKAQIAELTKCIRLSLSLISSIFCQNDGSPSLIHQILHTVVSHSDSDDKLQDPLLSEFTSRTHYKHLPDDVKDFRPSLPVAMTEIPSKTIHSLCSEWISNISSEVQSGVAKMFQHVSTIKGLAAIATTVHILLAESPGSDSKAEWEGVCCHVIGHSISLWGEFLQPVMYKRIQVIIDAYITSAEDNALKALDAVVDINQTLDLQDVSLVSSLFTEDNSDCITPTSLAQADHPTAWKVKSFTPTVLKFCSCVNKELEEGVTTDAKHIVKPQKNKTHHFSARLGDTKDQNEDFPFDLFSMDQKIRDYLSHSAFNFIMKLITRVDECLHNMKQAIETSKNTQESYYLVKRVLVIGRICKGLKECCPSLHGLVRGLESSSDVSLERKRLRLPSSSSNSKLHTPQTACQTDVNSLLWQRVLDAYRIWSEWLKLTVLEKFKVSLLGASPSSVLSSALLWEDVVITEESESGKTMESIIRIPSQVSSYVSWLLYALCREVVGAGGHALPSSFLRHLSFSLLESILALYKDLSSRMKADGVKLPQNCAVQYWFDVKVLSSVLVSQEKQGTTRNSLQDTSLRVIQELESNIDPFDLNVFQPYLNHFVDRQKQHCMVLLGPLAHSSGLGSSHGLSRTKPPGLPQERHQVIPLGPQVGRFTMLPIGTGSMLKRSTTSTHNKVWTESRASFPDVLTLYQSALDLD